jgi:ubiquinol-cytochrome c reductase cytochrome b subunit
VGKKRDWIIDRFALDKIINTVLHRRVPRGPWYYGDGATLLTLLGVLIVTGAFMTLTYAPTPDAAYHSVQYITETQRMGWFVRGLHYWAAGLMVFMLLFHFFRILLVGGYKAPREATYLIGCVMFMGVFIMSFSGYLLRWDERSLYAVKVFLHMLHRIPLIGEQLIILVQGGREIGPLTLTRLYSVHVIFTPLALLGLAGFHLYLVIVHGVTSMRERKNPVDSVAAQRKMYKEAAHSEEEGEHFYPETMAASGTMAFVVLSIAVGLTLLLGPQFLYPEANLVTPSIPEEEWWFWWVSGAIATLPSFLVSTLIILFPVLLLLFMFTLPFVDRRAYRGVRKRPAMAAGVVVAIVLLVVFSELRWHSDWTAWPTDELPYVPPGIELTEAVREGRQLFTDYGCTSCHGVSGRGPRVGPDIARISPLSRSEIRNFILEPPAGVAMPSYEGRMTEEELTRVIEFVHVAQTFPRER